MNKIQHCEKCGQKVMVYRRSISPAMIGCLRLLYLKYGMEPARLRDITDKRIQGSDFTKLKYWNLIEPGEEKNSYRVTFLGLEFMQGTECIKKYKWVYNGIVQKDDPFVKNPDIRVSDIDGTFPHLEKVLQEANTGNEHNARVMSGDLFK